MIVRNVTVTPVPKGVHPNDIEAHRTLGFAVVLSIFVIQALLILWNKFHHRSFQRVTLALLFVLPAIFVRSLSVILVWIVFCMISMRMVYLATREKIDRSTPRKVYRWFFLVHRATMIAIVTGYAMQYCAILIPPLRRITVFFEFEMSLLFQGLYFGVMNRDLAEVCADSLSSSLGFKASGPEMMPKRSLAPNVCAVCSEKLDDDPTDLNNSNNNNNNTSNNHDHSGIIDGGKIVSNEGSSSVPSFATESKTVVLGCKHRFHDFCIRGWVIVGKKDVCPYCSEKVSLAFFRKSGWGDRSALYATVLDVARYVIVWYPYLFFVEGMIITWSGFK